MQEGRRRVLSYAHAAKAHGFCSAGSVSRWKNATKRAAPIQRRDSAPLLAAIARALPVPMHEAEIGGSAGEQDVQPDVVAEQRDEAEGGVEPRDHAHHH